MTALVRWNSPPSESGWRRTVVTLERTKCKSMPCVGGRSKATGRFVRRSSRGDACVVRVFSKRNSSCLFFAKAFERNAFSRTRRLPVLERVYIFHASPRTRAPRRSLVRRLAGVRARLLRIHFLSNRPRASEERPISSLAKALSQSLPLCCSRVALVAAAFPDCCSAGAEARFPNSKSAL